MEGHCRLLRTITSSHDSVSVKRRRLSGVLAKLETSGVEWIAEAPSEAQRAKGCKLLLSTLSAAVPLMKQKDNLQLGGGVGMSGSATWSGVSPYFTETTNDTLCMCLQLSTKSASGPVELLELLGIAVNLQLSAIEPLECLVVQLTTRSFCAQAPLSQLVELLRLLSLAVKRCKLPPPPLDYLFCRLPHANLGSRESLQVLSSLVRLNDNKGREVCSVVSRKASQQVETYTVRDVIYGLEAVAMLDTCNCTYAGVVLDRCAELAPTMNSKEVGDVCKYISLLNTHRSRNAVAFALTPELRRVLPAIVERAQQLLGQFSLRDARCILRCLNEHHVRHSILFSRLTPFVSGD